MKYASWEHCNLSSPREQATTSIEQINTGQRVIGGGVASKSTFTSKHPSGHKEMPTRIVSVATPADSLSRERFGSILKSPAIIISAANSERREVKYFNKETVAGGGVYIIQESTLPLHQ